MKLANRKKSEQQAEAISDYRRLRFAAMDLLSRREHSRIELKRKLEQRFPASDPLLVQVLDELAEQKLQSDERFTEAFVRFRAMKGQGPLKIAAELRQRGISDSLCNRHLGSEGRDWFEAALLVSQKRFGGLQYRDARERAKRQRFLQQRGFSADQIHYALQSHQISLV